MPVDASGKRRWYTKDEKAELCRLFDDFPEDDAAALAERFNEIFKLNIEPVGVARILRDFGRSTRGRWHRSGPHANGTAMAVAPAPPPTSEPAACSAVPVSPVPDASAAGAAGKPPAGAAGPAGAAPVFREKPDRAIDRELRAMEAIHDHFVGLADEQIRRVLCWATMRYRLIGMSEHFTDKEQP